MIGPITKEHKDFRLSLKSANDGQVFLTASVKNEEGNPVELFKEVYDEVTVMLREYNIQVIHERIFGSNKFFQGVCSARKDILDMYYLDSKVPFTYLDGSPYWGEGISGVNIHGVVLESSTDEIKNISHEGKVCGRAWRNKDSEYLMLHGIYGMQDNNTDPYGQALQMFEKTNCILKENDFEFKNVIRTWIYLNEILKQYNEFNKARNLKFKEFGLISGEIQDNYYEELYMPASTGIGCNNVYKSSGIMDVFAIKKKENSILTIINETGKKQKSAYRYGSAFSRSMVIENDRSKYIYLSGTASIDDKGETVYLDDIVNQIEMTGSVIEALAKKENFDFSNLCEGTVFLKKAEYIADYEAFCQKHGLTKLPCVITVANVCRDNLLFEMDATFMGNKE